MIKLPKRPHIPAKEFSKHSLGLSLILEKTKPGTYRVRLYKG